MECGSIVVYCKAKRILSRFGGGLHGLARKEDNFLPVNRTKAMIPRKLMVTVF